MLNLKSNPKLAAFLKSEGIMPDQITHIEYTAISHSVPGAKNIDTGERRYVVKGKNFVMTIDTDKDNSFFRSRIDFKD